jgi:GNAT superfamily N-acetyltransferase
MKIRILKTKDISKSYIDTINHNSTKKFITFSKKLKKKINKTDLISYIKNKPINEKLYGIFENNTHKANFKLTITDNKIFIGFLVFLKYQGRGLIKKSFSKILKLKELKNAKSNKLYLGVNSKNKNAISLYIALGFKKVSRSNKYMYLRFKN